MGIVASEEDQKVLQSIPYGGTYAAVLSSNGYCDIVWRKGGAAPVSRVLVSFLSREEARRIASACEFEHFGEDGEITRCWDMLVTVWRGVSPA